MKKQTFKTMMLSTVMIISAVAQSSFAVNDMEMYQHKAMMALEQSRQQQVNPNPEPSGIVFEQDMEEAYKKAPAIDVRSLTPEQKASLCKLTLQEIKLHGLDPKEAIEFCN